MTDWSAMAKKPGRDWYLAASLIALGNEVNARWPNRDTASDGAKGDAAHAARTSDHNPDYSAGGVVRAIDVDNGGIDVQALLDATIGDQRVWYVIWDRHIYSRTHSWAKQAYAGPDPHTGHVHISINHTKAAETDTSPWFTRTTPGKDELDMDEKTLRAIIADELNKQDKELWVIGTGKQLVIDRLERVEAAVNEIKAKVQ